MHSVLYSAQQDYTQSLRTRLRQHLLGNNLIPFTEIICISFIFNDSPFSTGVTACVIMSISPMSNPELIKNELPSNEMFTSAGSADPIRSKYLLPISFHLSSGSSDSLSIIPEVTTSETTGAPSGLAFIESHGIRDYLCKH